MKHRKTILMVRPAAFGYNPETAVNNSFQQAPQGAYNAAEAAREEFDDMVAVLRNAGVSVLVLED
ncbi:MAG: amidinotransferase, partial [Phaeodactylibacter sp.]|nr:amidinotransferase [Phaeodactylibacter sp.]